MGVVYFSIIPTFEPSRYYKCWIVCFYYKIYPEKIPDIIFVDSRETSGWNDEQWAQWCEENGYTSRLILGSERILFKQNE